MCSKPVTLRQNKFSFSVLCHFKTWEIMVPNGFLSFVTRSNASLPTLLSRPCSVIHICTSLFGRLLTASVFPPVSPVTVKFSSPFFIKCQRNVNCLFWILSTSIVLASISIKTFSLFTCSDYDIRSILLLFFRKHILCLKFSLYPWRNSTTFPATENCYSIRVVFSSNYIFLSNTNSD